MTIPEPTRNLGAAQPHLALVKPKPRRTNKDRTFPPDPIKVEEFAALLAACTPQAPGRYGQLSAMRLRALIVILYRTGVRISEALAFCENDLDRPQQALVVRRGKGGKRRTVLMDSWAWAELERWIGARSEIKPGAIICVLRGQGAGLPLADSDARRQLRDAGIRAGLRRRVNPHNFRHGFAVGTRREGIDLEALQAQLGHAHLGITEIYLRAVDPMERLAPFARREPPRIVVPPATS